MINHKTMAAAERLSRHSREATRWFASGNSPMPSAKVTTFEQKTTEPAPSAAIPSNEQLRAEYERSPALQHEFINFTDFAAFKRAEARGAFRLLRRVA